MYTSDTTPESDDLSTTQEYTIAGIVILLFGLLYWLFNYGMPGFSADAAPPSTTVIAGTANTTAPDNVDGLPSKRMALGETDNGDATGTNSTASAARSESQPAAQPNTPQANRADNTDKASETDSTRQLAATTDNKQSAGTSTALVAATGIAVTTTSTAGADNNDPNVNATHTTPDTDNTQKAGTAAITPQTDHATTQQNQTAVNTASGTDNTDNLVIMDKAVSKLRDHLLNKALEQSVLMDNIRFADKSFAIEASSEHQIQGIADLMQQHPTSKILIRGHSADEGSAAENKTLSLMRANAMGEKLVAAGADAGKIIIMGMGNTEPLSSNKTQQGRGKNRRIDIAITQ